MRRLRVLDGLFGDLTLAARRLRATPLFLLFAASSLALGVGATTAVYATLYDVFWKPLGIRDSSEVVIVTTPQSGGGRTYLFAVTREDVDELRRSLTSLGGLAASAPDVRPLTSAGGGQVVEVEAVSGDYFQTLGIGVVRGRAIGPDDDRLGVPVVVLSHSTWRRHFRADPDVIGQPVRIGSRTFEIVGVAAESFEGPLARHLLTRTAVWIPLRAADDTAADPAAQRRRPLIVMGRVAPGSTPARASAELAAAAERLDSLMPLAPVQPSGVSMPRRWQAHSIESVLTTEMSRMGWLLFAFVGLLLVVACSNLAILMRARGLLRQHESAVRHALGASRWRLARELVVEGAVVAVIGGVLAIAVTHALLVLLTGELPGSGPAFLVEPTLGLPALGAGAAALFLSLLMFAVEPALQLTRGVRSADLAGGPGRLGTHRSGRERVLLRWQVAVSVCFFLIAAVLGRVIVTEARHDPGIDMDRLAVVRVPFALLGWDEARARRAIDETLARARMEPTLVSAAASTGLPFGVNARPARIGSSEMPSVPGEGLALTSVIAATPAIFQTLGVRIVSGRGFDEHDDAAALPVVVVSVATARRILGTEDAVGREVMLQTSFGGDAAGQPLTVVGVAADTDTGRLMSRSGNTVYVPLAQRYWPDIAITARTTGPPSDAARLIQAALRAADPEIGTAGAGPARWMLAGPYAPARIAAAVSTVLGGLTLLLAMIGLYGVQARMVGERTRELGVRLALGAEPGRLARMVLREGFRPVLEGLALGFLFGTVIRLGLRMLLDAPIPIVDPIALGVAAIPLVAAAACACSLPAYRASRVEPAVALQHL